MGGARGDSSQGSPQILHTRRDVSTWQLCMPVLVAAGCEASPPPSSKSCGRSLGRWGDPDV